MKIEDLPTAIKGRVIVKAIDVAGQTLDANRDRLAHLFVDTHEGMTLDDGKKAVALTIDVMMLAYADAVMFT